MVLGKALPPRTCRQINYEWAGDLSSCRTLKIENALHCTALQVKKTAEKKQGHTHKGLHARPLAALLHGSDFHSARLDAVFLPEW